MQRLALVLAALASAGALAGERPMLIRETQRIDPPSAGYHQFAHAFGIDRDHAIIVATRFDQCCSGPNTQDALLYRHDGSSWIFDRILHTRRSDSALQSTRMPVAMGNGFVALDADPLLTFRRNGNQYTAFANPFAGTPQVPDSALGGFLKWSGNTLFVSRAQCASSDYTWGGFTATVGAGDAWSTPLPAPAGGVSCSNHPESFDFSGDTITAATWADDFMSNTTYVLRRTGATWNPSWSVPHGRGQAAARPDVVFVSNDNPAEVQVYRNDGSLAVVDRLRRVLGDPGGPFAISASYAVIGDSVFQKDANGRFRHVATLATSADNRLLSDATLSGRRLLFNGQHGSNVPAAFVYDLPATFVPTVAREYDFEGVNTGTWTVTDGQFAVVTRGATRVYRQASTTGDGRAVLANDEWNDQSVEADIRPTSFAGADRWAGLAVRYVDANNHYYVTLRNSGIVELRKKIGGVVTSMGQLPLAVVAGRNYRVALTARGGRITASIDGESFGGIDTAIPRGRPALLTWRTQADFDNVIVSRYGRENIYDALQQCTAGDLQSDLEWTRSGTGQWSCLTRVVTQTDTSGDARAVVGTSTGDQIIQARARATAFAAPGGAQERWFGLAARYTDASNYYYVTVRNSNTVSLRKLVNGTITVLGTAPLTVSAGTWYDLRLDAIDDKLRVFVDGTPVIQASDASHPAGQSGAVMFKTAAEYERLRSWQP